MKKKVNTSIEEFKEPEPGEGPGYPGALKMDRDEWLPYVAEFDISEEKKTELLEKLWEIMTILVYRGWGVDLVHKAIPALAEFSLPEESGGATLETLKEQYNGAAEGQPAQKGEMEHGISKED